MQVSKWNVAKKKKETTTIIILETAQQKDFARFQVGSSQITMTNGCRLK